MSRSRYLDNFNSHSPLEGWDGYRFGSESCFDLLPEMEQIIKISGAFKTEGLTLVTPIAGPGQDLKVMKVVETALEMGWGEIVINDWGILDQAGKLNGPRVTAGRLLMRFRRGPGEFDLWDELDETSKRYFAWGPLYDSGFLDFLGQMGVTRLELDLPRHWLRVPEVDGFALSLHLEERLITVSASCPWLYDGEADSWTDKGSCGQQCRTGKDITMTNTKLDQPLILRGKAVLEKVQEGVALEKLPANVDRVIYSYQLPAGEGMAF
ncbi:MAG: hypothetical protein P1S46_08670 [bacterium]|nr:hypothetical protein [bacterium]MDT8396613.1 hypothetical protein [bacterium]